MQLSHALFLTARMNHTANIYQQFDFAQLKSKDFKEDSVREVLILPLLAALGYTNYNIVRSKTLQHPYLKIGSKKRPVSLVPDYLFKIDSSYAWVLDAKSPDENIRYGDNVEQVYSYATHPEIRTKYFALCNGQEFTLFRQDSDDRPILDFQLKEIDQHWEDLARYLAPDAFQTGKSMVYEPIQRAGQRNSQFDYINCQLLEEIKVDKQSAKRHFGVHGYFTKQAWNVVQEYIKNFTKPGDLVLDPFGGSGVTAIEAMMTGRKAVHLDLNPMSVFIVNGLVAPVKTTALGDAFQRVKDRFEKLAPQTPVEVADALMRYPYPKNISLPKGSDVDSVEQLFSPKQLAQLALLKHLISGEKDINIRQTLMLMFSGLITKTNLTYHTSSSRPAEGQGDNSAFRYYRYRIAPQPIEVDVMKYFELRFKKVLNAKKEIASHINSATISSLQVVKGTATNLTLIKNETVDYIYTDPPYGKKIAYLDLSTMWNAWLDLPVTEQDYKQEAIEGGDHKKSKDEYNRLMAESIREMYRVLKFDRWMSFVFAHKDPEFWHLIIDTAEQAGFEYAGAVKQANGQSSFKKRQHPFTVLSGQLIINFKKVRRPRTILKAHLGINIGEIVVETVEGIIAKHDGATLEQINDELIIKGLELGFLDLLKKEYTDLTPLLMDLFDYDNKEQTFKLRQNRKFQSHIDIKLRVRYFLTSYLRRMQLEKKTITLEEIVFHIMPLLKNGSTPEHQTILNVLEDIAEHVGNDSWQLKQGGQMRLFV